ncbi:MAG: glycoside hydrolase family 16 protein [Candidatus Electrothrix scaldis]|nr:MAG: glycoside hydrolase family 16 protein [Candidatus Electrothrix sp. GW3-3]
MLQLRTFLLLQILAFLPATASAELLLDLPPILAGALKNSGTCTPVSNPFSFSGLQWTVRSGSGGPGPNNWAAENVCIDENGWLHLNITEDNGTWSSAEIQTVDSLGFGTYQFWIIGQTDTLDPNVTLGLFNYGTEDCIQEIDIELGALGSNSPVVPLHYSVYPNTEQATCPASCSASSGNCEACETGKYYCTTGGNYTLSGSYSTHRFTWQSTGIRFQSLHGHQDDDSNSFADWTYAASSSPIDVIPQSPLPVHINYWLFQGATPTDGKTPQEIIIRQFSYTPEP